MPEIHELFDGAKNAMNSELEKETIEVIYPLCVSISIDYGILEKADNVYVIPSSFGWSDLGTWGSAYENLEKDYHENAVAGNNIILFDSSKNIIHTTGDKLILLQGLDDFIVVDTPDAYWSVKKKMNKELKNTLPK